MSAHASAYITPTPTVPHHLAENPGVPPFLNADLHSHSTHSDGALAPAEVAALARAGEVDLWALTDHDTLAGQAQAREAALDLGLAWVGGVEISVSLLTETIHVLGLGVDVADAALEAGLAHLRAGRVARAQAMAQSLARVGIPGAFEGAAALAPNLPSISRTHFARWLVQTGRAPSVGEVFQHYLRSGKPGYVPHTWATLGAAVGWIRRAGGVAVIAHPGRYRLGPGGENALLAAFTDLGGTGIEVVCGSHTAAEVQLAAQQARTWGLAASRGSDFHALDESRVLPGRLTALPPQLTPVWQRAPLVQAVARAQA